MHKRPNVIFILTDDQGYGDLACHGNPYIKTSNIDNLYRESVHLTDYHVGPTCSPTRSGLLTGHYANSTGVWHTVGGRSLLRQNEKTIAQFFKESGYKTGMFGKWHLGDNSPYLPEDRGFDEVVTHGGGAIGNTPDYWGNNYMDDHYRKNKEWIPYKGYCTDVWFNEALNFIDENKEEPFFCYIPTNSPHSPHIVPEKYKEYYYNLAKTDEKAAEFFGYPESDEMIKFYGMVTNIDENIGILRKKLSEWQLDHNTILIFMTDNGTGGGVITGKGQYVTHGFNNGMRGQKCSQYEGGHRVPFFMHWPKAGINQSQDIDILTANVDIVPTLLDLCNVGNPENIDFHGQSLAKLFLKPESVWEYDERIIVTDSQRLIQPLKWRLSSTMYKKWRLVCGEELYNLETDPGERNDIAAYNLEMVKKLRAGYENWWDIVSKQFDEDIPIPLPIKGEESILLTSFDWRNESAGDSGITGGADDAHAIFCQTQVRHGLTRYGYWEIEVKETGKYQFDLHRWPKEEMTAVGEGIPGGLNTVHEIDKGLGGGKKLDIKKAQIQIDDQILSKEVAGNEKDVKFELYLTAGLTHLHAEFSNDEGLNMTPYYVYVSFWKA